MEDAVIEKLAKAQKRLFVDEVDYFFSHRSPGLAQLLARKDWQCLKLFLETATALKAQSFWLGCTSRSKTWHIANS